MPHPKQNSKSGDVEPVADHVEVLTILRARVPITKTLTRVRDGNEVKWTKSVEHEYHAKWFTVALRTVDNLASFHLILASATSRDCLVHGVPARRFKPDEPVLRRTTNFNERPHRLFVIDLDDMELPGVSLKTPRVKEAAAHAVARLPPEFHGCEYIAQATSGHALKPGAVRLRLFFWTDRPIALSEAKAWAAGFPIKVDLRIYRNVQEIYIAPPIIEGAKSDPIADRTVRIKATDGVGHVKVPENLPVIAREHQKRDATAPEGVIVNAAHALDRFVGMLHGRKPDTIDSRHVAFYNAALDAHDLAIEEDVAEAMIELWGLGDDAPEQSDDEPEALSGRAEYLRDRMSDAGIPDDVADNIVEGIARARVAVADRMLEGDPIDMSDVERMVGDAYRGATGAFGCRWKAETTGEAFGAVTDDDEPASALSTFAATIRELAASGADPDAGDDALAVLEAGIAEMDEAERERLLGFATSAVASLAIDAETVEADLVRIEPKAKKPKKLVTLSTELAASVHHFEWVIKGVVPKLGTGIFIADANVGKTGVVMDMAHHITSSPFWAGRRIPCNETVLYVGGEGMAGISNRMKALSLHYGELGAFGTMSLDETTSLFLNRKGAVAKILAGVRELEQATGKRVAMIVLDTLAALAIGMDENSATDAGLILGAMREIGRKAGCFVLAIHHLGKDQSRGARGSSALRGNVDTVLKLEEDTKTGIITVEIDKQRDGAKGVLSSLTLKTVHLGVDADGDPLTSFVIDWKPEATPSKPSKPRAAAPTLPKGPKLSSREAEVFDSIKRASDGGGEEWLQVADVLRLVNETRKAEGDDEEMKTAQFRNLRHELETKRLITQDGKGRLRLSVAGGGFGPVDDGDDDEAD